MISWSGNNNRTITGYLNKEEGKGNLITSKYVLESKKTTVPFLLTRDSLFEVSNVEEYIQHKKEEKNFNTLKNRLANILVIPGLLVSIVYVLKLLGELNRVAILESLFEGQLLNSFFWLSMLGVIILWHDHFKNKSPFSKLPIAPYIPETEFEELKANGLSFGRFGQVSVFNYLSYPIIEILAKEVKKKKNVDEYLSTLLSQETIIEVLKRAGIDAKDISLTTDISADKNFLIMYSLEEALITNSPEILPIHLFLALVKTVTPIGKEISKRNSSLNVLREITSYMVEQALKVKYSYLNPLVPYYPTGGIAKSWIYGYTFVLSHFSKDINEAIAKDPDTYGIGHEKEVESLISVLGKATKRNALLIGEPGSGKSSLIKGIAQRINRGDIHPQLQKTRIVQLDLNGLIAYSSGKKNVEKTIQKAMDELGKAGNVILYIDELQELIPSKAEETGHSIAGILLPYVEDGKFPIVGTVNYADYKKYFYTNESFRQSFTNIEIPELPARDTLKILETKIPILEKMHKLYITFPALISSVEYAQRYITNRMLPDSAVSILEDACSWGHSNGVSILTEDHVAKVVSLNTNIAVGDITSDEAEKLLSLEERIKEKVIGQDEAVHIISESLRRARADVRDPKKPIGVFLFIGPTGVGKTYLAKIVSQEYFTNNEDIVRIDMSEYMEENSVSKLLGTEQKEGNQTQITLLDKVKTNPYTTILFDEVEKANPKILDLFLQLFDEGRLTSTNGEVVDFTNAIIICTSNIGSDVILENLEKGSMWEETKNLVMMKLKQTIRPELFNRFDGIVIFHPQTVEQLVKISDMLLEELRERLKEKNIEIDWDSTIPMLIANKAFEPGLGARPIKRYIQEKIEGNIAQEIISEEIKKGDTIKVKESWIV